MGPRGRRLVFATMILLGIGGGAVSAVQGAQPDLSRYRWHNSEWWYQMPAGDWMYWRNNRWNEYRPAAELIPAQRAPLHGANVAAPAEAARQSDRSSRATEVYQRAEQIGPFYDYAAPQQ